MLLEISTALGLLYYHIIFPLMRATGIEGDCFPLRHKDFLTLFPDLVLALEMLSIDPSMLCRKVHLDVFLSFSESDIHKNVTFL